MKTGVFGTPFYVPPLSEMARHNWEELPLPMILLPQDENKGVNCTCSVLSHLEVAWGMVSVLPDLECYHDQCQSLKDTENRGKKHVRADDLQADARGARDQTKFTKF